MTIGLQTSIDTMFAYRFANWSSCVNDLLLCRGLGMWRSSNSTTFELCTFFGRFEIRRIVKIRFCRMWILGKVTFVALYVKKEFVNKPVRFRLCDVTLAAGSRVLTKQSTAPILLADVTTGNGLKMASTAAYNLWDNHSYPIVNFNFNLTVIHLQQLNYYFAQACKTFLYDRPANSHSSEFVISNSHSTNAKFDQLRHITTDVLTVKLIRASLIML